jgi:hypothetical protein
MRITSIAFAMLAGLAQWAQGCNKAEPIVRVKAQNALAISPAIVEPAKALASQLFSRMGVELRWGKPPRTPPDNAGCIEEAVVIEMLICSAPQVVHERFSPGALGYARPHASSGVRIYVFYDRVPKGQYELTVSILGYVFAHEIAHVLEEECRHSQQGIMKAHWERADHSQMAVRRLSFAPEDVALIHAGLARQLVRPSADMVIASNGLQPTK